MKKMLLIAVLCSSFVFAKAQNYDDVTKYLVLKHPDQAVPEINKLTADAKAQKKPDTWFYKGAVYAAIYADANLRAKYPNAGFIADTALTKYAQMDTSFGMVKQYSAQPFYDIYTASRDEGVRTFNSKKWDSASIYFGLSEFYSEYLFKRKWIISTATFDTVITQYTGFAYQNSDKPDMAMKYYKIMAANKVGGSDLENMYRFMLNYYSKNKDNADFESLLAEVRQLYPQDAATWDDYATENMAATMTLDDMVAKYKQDDAAGKITTADQYTGYGETFAIIPKETLSKMDSAKQFDFKYLAADAYSKAFNLSNNGLFAFNAGLMYYNVYSALDDRFYNLRGEAAGLKAQRSVVEKQEFVLADSAAQWLTKAYTTLKAKTDRAKNESNCLNRSVDFLATIYAWERDKNRGVNPANYDKYDALFNKFDAEHDKYKQ